MLGQKAYKVRQQDEFINFDSKKEHISVDGLKGIQQDNTQKNKFIINDDGDHSGTRSGGSKKQDRSKSMVGVDTPCMRNYLDVQFNQGSSIQDEANTMSHEILTLSSSSIEEAHIQRNDHVLAYDGNNRDKKRLRYIEGEDQPSRQNQRDVLQRNKDSQQEEADAVKNKHLLKHKLRHNDKDNDRDKDKHQKADNQSSDQDSMEEDLQKKQRQIEGDDQPSRQQYKDVQSQIQQQNQQDETGASKYQHKHKHKHKDKHKRKHKDRNLKSKHQSLDKDPQEDDDLQRGLRNLDDVASPNFPQSESIQSVRKQYILHDEYSAQDDKLKYKYQKSKRQILKYGPVEDDDLQSMLQQYKPRGRGSVGLMGQDYGPYMDP